MGIDLGLIAGDALFPIAGYAYLRAVGAASPGRGGLRLFGLSYLVGWALLGSLLSLLLMAGADPGVPTTVATVGAVVLASVVVARRAGHAACPARPRTRNPFALAVAAAGAAAIALTSASAIVVACTSEWNPAHDFDALWFWIPKAETIYYFHGLDASAWGSFPHPEYPPLLPTLDALTFHFASGFHPSLLVLQQALLGIAFLLGGLELLRRVAPAWLAFPSVALLATTSWFYGGLASPMPDLAVGCLTAAGAGAALLWLATAERRWIGVAFPLLAAASLTKLEGNLYAALLVVVVLACAFAVRRRAALPALALVLAPALILPWHLWLATHGLPTTTPDYSLGDLFNLHYLSAHTGRLREGANSVDYALKTLSYEAVGGHWRLLAYLAALLLVARRATAAVAAAVVWVAAASASLIAIYWIARPEISTYINVTLWRVTPTFIIVAATLVPLLIGIGLAAERRAEPAPVSADTRVRRPRWLPRTLATAGVALVAVIGAFEILSYLSNSKLASAASAPVNVHALDQELDTQFGLGLVAHGYYFSLFDWCDVAEPDRLVFACHIGTINLKYPSQEPGFNVVVYCEPRSSHRPRCVSSAGQALQ